MWIASGDRIDDASFKKDNLTNFYMLNSVNFCLRRTIYDTGAGS
jgi:hypothetical protein